GSQWQGGGAGGGAGLFDAVAVCNGHHQSPRWPAALPGQAGLRIPLIHSQTYRTPQYPIATTGKSIPAVGTGNSACDIAAEVSRTARQVYLSTRSGGWVFPRRLRGKPVDMADYESRFHKLWMRPWLAKLLDGYLMQRVRQRYFGPEGNLKRYGL